MSLPYGLLGLLMYQESTGYELTKAFENSLNNFWHAQSSQIYRELDRMEKEELVVSRQIIQERRPNKRVYAITEKGRLTLQSWLGSGTIEFKNTHVPLLVRVFFGANAPEVTLTLLKACHKMCLNHVETLQMNATASIDHYASAIPDGDSHRLYWEMTLEYGITSAQAIAKWAQSCIEKLEREIRE